jgi:FixJ family two-component response regulator
MPEIQVVICVVDDDAMVRKAIARLLRAAGFTTETFASAETFLRSPHQEVCTCLILDIDLPGQSGRELAHSFTAAKSHVPIIFLTAWEPRAADACPSRAVTWLTKPCEADDLFAAIREALTRAGKDSA